MAAEAGQGRVGARAIIGEVWLLRQDRGGLGEGHHRRSVAAEARQGRVGGGHHRRSVAAEARQGRVGGGPSSEKCGC